VEEHDRPFADGRLEPRSQLALEELCFREDPADGTPLLVCGDEYDCSQASLPSR
jgi:hypothetical protein